MISVILILVQQLIVSDSSYLDGFNIISSEVVRENEIVTVNDENSWKIELYGTGIGDCQELKLTESDSDCSQMKMGSFTLTVIQEFQVDTTLMFSGQGTYMFCLKCLKNATWLHQGSEAWKQIKVLTSIMNLPHFVWVVFIIILLILSGLCSGMNLGLMTLQPSSLKLIMEAGSIKEKKYAKLIYPIRKHGNILLCTLLLSNVLVNSALTLCLNHLINDYILTLTVTTFGIVIFGEIIPQAFGARYALILSAYTIWLSVIFLFLTCVLSFPIGKLLNYILGQELNLYYSKDKLRLLIKEQEKFGCVMRDEIDIMSGALALQEKTVMDVMTPISHAYLLSNDTTLDYATMKEIVYNGYTRIPIYDTNKTNITGILNIKDLTFIDPDDCIPVSTVCTFYKRHISTVNAKTRLPEMLKEFRKGKNHLALIENKILNINGKEEKIVIGLVTLEDVIEEIIQDEIVDETDVFIDNTLLRKITTKEPKHDNFKGSQKMFYLSPQLYRAVMAYLTSNLPSFHSNIMKKTVLQSLLQTKLLVHHYYANYQTDQDFCGAHFGESNVIIKAGKPIISAILIIQGKVSVHTSCENLTFEGGPFMIFGESILNKVNLYLTKSRPRNPEMGIMQSILQNFQVKPDYTVIALTNVQYLSVSAAQYMLARHLSFQTTVHDVIDRTGWEHKWSILADQSLT